MPPEEEKLSRWIMAAWVPTLIIMKKAAMSQDLIDSASGAGRLPPPERLPDNIFPRGALSQPPAPRGAGSIPGGTSLAGILSQRTEGFSSFYRFILTHCIVVNSVGFPY